MKNIKITGTKAQGTFGEYYELLSYIKEMISTGLPIAVDIETSPTEEYDKKSKAPKPGLFPPKSKIELIQLSDGVHTYVMPWNSQIIIQLEQIKTLVAHSAKFELKQFRHHCKGLLTINCTEMLSRIVDASHYSADGWGLLVYQGYEHKPGHTLGSCVERFLNVKLPKDQATSDWAAELTDEQLTYAASDAYWCAKLYDKLRGYVTKLKCDNVYELYIKTIRVCAAMELEGFPVNKAVLQDQIRQWKEVREKHINNLTFYFEGINLRSPKQMREWFTEKYPDKVKDWARTEPSKTNPEGNLTFDSNTLQLNDDIPEFKELLKFRKVDKLLSTYGHGLEEALVLKEYFPCTFGGGWQGGVIFPGVDEYRIHSSFRVGSTTTGRMSSSAPNLQNLPRDDRKEDMITTIPNRHIFQPIEGRSFVAADYSQIELRVAATVSNDKYMMQCYNEGVDLHKAIVAELMNKPIEAVSKSERQLGKAVNFGLLYGMGASKLKRYAKISYGADMEERDAKKFYDKFHSLYKGYSKWCDYVREKTVRSGYVRTPLGRLRKLTEADHYTRCVNTIVQGGAAEVVMLALVYCNKYIKNTGKLVNVVHDEIIIECGDSYTRACEEMLSAAMTKAYNKIFPNGPVRDLIEVNVGKSWSEVK